ncbi:diguanylate cyclase [Coralloluteibacterium stylophorae]|uniref:diguanylate cyclase n=1 Tax=Coralloluteibacterium stylophorae TaxID=1776034 RepID=A0A8J7VU43_9GAMM|nr:diguanylate cyclase [Coralloluteibacterium stylophorae]MBS7457528.1 diguanylate cyclase [Coralloluteibacterium stylophorae]
MRSSPHRIQWGLLVAALLFTLIGIGVYLGAQRSISDARWVSHTNAVIGRIDEIQALLREAESTQRGYLLTGSIEALADYRNAIGDLPRALDGLEAVVADNPAQQARAGRLRGLVQTRLQQLGATLDRFRTGGLGAAQRAIDAHSLDVSHAIGELGRDMVAVEKGLLARRSASSAASSRLLLALSTLGILAGLAIVAAVYVMLRREMRQRARAEAASAEALARLEAGNGELRRSGEDLHTLGRYAGMLQSCQNVEEAVEVTRVSLTALFPGHAGCVYLMRASRDHLERMCAWGAAPTEAETAFLPDECWALRRSQSYLVHDSRQELLCGHVHAPAQAAVNTLCLPLFAQGEGFGVLHLAAAGTDGTLRVEIAAAAAEQLSLALSNLRLRERLRQQSIRDPLTGLYNRRYLEESLLRDLARCARRTMPLAVLMLDLDRFKAFNDTHGHAGGDALLAEFGRLLQSQVRGEDVACRYGGEEFTLILPEADADTALARAEAIRAATRELRVVAGGRPLPAVSVSIGLAMFPAVAETGTGLLEAADAALYQAKAEGRDRVVPAQRGMARRRDALGA